MSSVPGRRAIKAEATRTRITEAALALFLKRGFDATTIDDIAAAADVSRRSFFNYFQSKDDVIMTWQDQVGARLAEAVMARPEGESAVTMAKNAFLDLVSQYEPEKAMALARLTHDTPILKAREAVKYAGMETKLGDALIRRLKRPADDVEVRLVAAFVVGVVRIASNGEPGRLKDESTAAYGLRLFDVLTRAVSVADG